MLLFKMKRFALDSVGKGTNISEAIEIIGDQNITVDTINILRLH